MNSLRTPICILQDNKILDGNNALLILFNLKSKNELAQINFYDVSADIQEHGETSFIWFKKILNDIKTSEVNFVLKFNWTFKGVAGHPVYTLCSISRWETSSDKLLLEISEINNLQYKLLQSQEISYRFQNMFAEAPIGIILRDLQGKILHANLKMQNIIGYKEVDLALVPFHLLLTDKSKKTYENSQVTMNLLEKLELHELELIHQEGRVIYASNAEMMVKDHRGKKQIWSFFTDLTEMKKNARELEMQQLKSLSSAKLASIGEMAGGIAHEINNPLTIISGKARIIGRALDAPELDLVAIKDHCAKIEATVMRISKIITGLKNFSRDTENEQPKVINLLKLLDETYSFCSEKFKNHGINFEIAVAADLKLECREVQLAQIVLNLLNNAHDAIYFNGQPSSPPWIKISAEEKNDKILIRIIDSGQGISIAVQEKMFQPFFTTKEVGSGTGLGLSVSRGMVEKNNGKIYHDEENPNTCFVLEFHSLKI